MWIFSLDVDLEHFDLIFLLKKFLALVVTNNCGAHRNRVEARSGEDFGHNWSKPKCFQVQPVTCCDLLVFFNSLGYIL